MDGQKRCLIEFFVVFFISAAATCTILTMTYKPKKPPTPTILTLDVLRYTEAGEPYKERIQLDQKDTLFYVDAWRSHWCPYYNDRAFYLTPRINEFLHLARSRGFKIFHLHWKAHEDNIDHKLRERAKNMSSAGETPIIRDMWADNGKNNSKYIPGFKDGCMLDGYKRFGPVRCQKPNPDISVANDDYVAFNFKSIANVAHYLKAKTVILTGMHTNLCIRSAAIYLGWDNISVGYINDLLDAGFWFPGQHENGVSNHTKMNAVTYKYGITYHGWGAETFDVMRALKRMPAVTKEPKWTMYPEQAIPFKRFYMK